MGTTSTSTTDSQRRDVRITGWLFSTEYNESGKPNKSDLARALGVRPQSLYKWERLCKADRNFPLPILRAKQAAEFFGVKPSLFRPDIFGAA